MRPAKKTPAAHAVDWLKTQPAFRDLAARAEDLLRLQADLDACAPVRGLVAASLNDGVLTLIAANAGLAAKVRQFEPSLTAGLARSGWKISRIKCRPQPGRVALGPDRPGPPRADKPQIPPHAIASFEQLATHVEPGALRDAMHRLVKRRRAGGP